MRDLPSKFSRKDGQERLSGPGPIASLEEEPARSTPIQEAVVGEGDEGETPCTRGRIVV